MTASDGARRVLAHPILRTEKCVVLVTPHPARWSAAVLDVIAGIVEPLPVGVTVDPFAGVGGGRLADAIGRPVVGLELEPEWAASGSLRLLGNALFLPLRTESVDLVITSCLAQEHRLLTDDLRWVPAGEVRVGEELLAFDQNSPGLTARGSASRRRWARSEVVRSVPKRVEGVRVVLANGDEILTTPEHPWLTQRYAYGGYAAEWTPSRALAGHARPGGPGSGRGHRGGNRQPFYVSKQLEPWTPSRSFDAGWLSGMFDGEGSLALGMHGAPKLQLTQVEGAVLDRAERLMEDFGYMPKRYLRKQVRNLQPVVNLYVAGGFPGLLRALGELRPGRLLGRWQELDITSRTIQPEYVRVIAVEPAGRIDIQEIETTSGTYIGEGYLHHNCTYGNRMADHHDAQERCRVCGGEGVLGRGSEGELWPCDACDGLGRRDYKRLTYKHQLGREPHPDSSTTMAWGATYRQFHSLAWGEVLRVLKPSGSFLLNLKNHHRKGKVARVAEWHLESLVRAGLALQRIEVAATPGMKMGQNRAAREDHEFVFVLGSPA